MGEQYAAWESESQFKEWDADRMFLIDTDTKSFRGHDEEYREMSLDWELFDARDENNQTDHYEVWINGRWSDNFDTEEEAREYIKVYGK